jgi:hypothetical protein
MLYAAAASCKTAIPQMLMAGFLPCNAIYVKLTILQAFWLMCQRLLYAAAASCRTAFPQMLMAGFLPFSAIYVEL